MLPNHSAITLALIPQPEVCHALGQTRSGLDKLRKKDPTFPRPVKMGESRQAACYYVIAEINAWLASKIEAREVA